MVGACFFVVIIWFAQQHMGGKGAWGINAMNIAQHKLHHDFGQAVALGVLCNLMVCLAVWMTFSCRSAIDKILVMLLPIAMFVASGFEHSIANMFMIPMAIIIKTFAIPEFWAMTGHSPAEFAELTLCHFIFNNLLPVTLGNIIGGGFLVGMTYWVIHRWPGLKTKLIQQSPSVYFRLLLFGKSDFTFRRVVIYCKGSTIILSKRTVDIWLQIDNQIIN